MNFELCLNDRELRETAGYVNIEDSFESLQQIFNLLLYFNFELCLNDRELRETAGYVNIEDSFESFQQIFNLLLYFICKILSYSKINFLKNGLCPQ